jgi:hypothetical protein
MYGVNNKSHVLKFSNIIFNSRYRYYLNESEEFRIFWAKWTMEEEMFPDTEITALPAFAHNRFGIGHELAFKLYVCWIAAMTYISTVRLNDASAIRS